MTFLLIFHSFIWIQKKNDICFDDSGLAEEIVVNGGIDNIFDSQIVSILESQGENQRSSAENEANGQRTVNVDYHTTAIDSKGDPWT